MTITECLCRDAAKKYRCYRCGVYRDNLFDMGWQLIAYLDEHQEAVVSCDAHGAARSLKSEGNNNTMSNRNRKNRNRKNRKAIEAAKPIKHDEVFQTPDAWYRCVGWKKFGQTALIRYVPLENETFASADEVDEWTEEFVSQRIEAKTWTNHGKLPIRAGQKFSTQGVTKPRICAGWSATGILLYRMDEGSPTVQTVHSWTIKYIRERFHQGGWKIESGSQKKAQNKKPFVIGGTNTATKGGHYGSKCRHYHRPVQLPGGFVVHASSMNNNRKDGDGLPDWGLYADWGWRPYWRSEHIDWPDFGIPFDDTIALEQIIVAVEKVQAGKDVEIGCIGGHGRTGTILAAMRVILGEDTDTAIKTVRSEYCSHAIETPEQEWWVEWVESAVTGKPLAEKPTSYASFGYGNYQVDAEHKAGASPKYKSDWENGAECSQSSHFYAWLKGISDICPRSNSCRFWDSDVKTFVLSEKSMLRGVDIWPKGMMKDASGDPQPFSWHKERAATGAYHPNDPRSKMVSTKAPNEGRRVTILLTDGKIVESSVSDSWAAEPTSDGRYPFEIKDDNWQWINDEKTWVWIGALSDDDFALRVNLAVMNRFPGGRVVVASINRIGD